jgi:hypothetical protein
MNQAKITSASIYQRPKQSGIDLVGHWGVVVKIEGYSAQLIHNTPDSGTIVTSVSNMSNKWSKLTDIPVKGTKTIQGCLKSSGGALSTYISNSLVNYLLGGFCTGTASKIFEYLVQ